MICNVYGQDEKNKEKGTNRGDIIGVGGGAEIGGERRGGGVLGKDIGGVR